MSASRNLKAEEKEVSSHSTEVLQDVTRRVKEGCDILNHETNRVCKEGEARDEPAKTLEQNPFPQCWRPHFLDQFGNLEKRCFIR